MKEKGFCESCMRENEKCYGKTAEKIAIDPQKSPIEKHQMIAQNRIEARADLCREVNSDKLNPNYKGKDKL